MRRNGTMRRAARLAAVAAFGLLATACVRETAVRGYVFDDRLLAEVRPGTDAQAVLKTLGSPSTVSTVGNQTWYYISQTSVQRLAFMTPAVVDQRVLAIQFNKGYKVERIANYGVQDGRLFDFISRTTPTGGTEPSVVRQLFRAAGIASGPAP